MLHLWRVVELPLLVLIRVFSHLGLSTAPLWHIGPLSEIIEELLISRHHHLVPLVQRIAPAVAIVKLLALLPRLGSGLLPLGKIHIVRIV